MTEAANEKTQPQLRVGAAAAVLTCESPSMLKDAAANEIALEGLEVTIGRGSGNTVKLNSFGMSRRHARFFQTDNRWHVEDCGSTNGTRVNDKRIETHPLSDGDMVSFGRVPFTFRIIGEANAEVADDPGATPVGAAEETPGIIPDEAKQPEAPPQDAPALPGQEQFYDTGTHPRLVRDDEQPSGSRPTVWIALLLLACAAAAAAAVLLDLF